MGRAERPHPLRRRVYEFLEPGSPEPGARAVDLFLIALVLINVTVGLPLATFILGGFMTQFARRFLPAGAVKEFLTTGVTPSVGPLSIDLVIRVTA